jgi:hypothetical protein
MPLLDHFPPPLHGPRRWEGFHHAWATFIAQQLNEEVLEVKNRGVSWESPSGLYAVAYRAVTVRKHPRVEVWPEALNLGQNLPIMPLWLSLDLCVRLPLEKSYATTCRSLRISA